MRRIEIIINADVVTEDYEEARSLAESAQENVIEAVKGGLLTAGQPQVEIDQWRAMGSVVENADHRDRVEQRARDFLKRVDELFESDTHWSVEDLEGYKELAVMVGHEASAEAVEIAD